MSEPGVDVTGQVVRISRAVGGWDFHVPVDILPGYPDKGYLLLSTGWDDGAEEYLGAYARPGLRQAVADVRTIRPGPYGLQYAHVRDVFHDFPDGTSRLCVSVSHVVDEPELRLQVAEVIRDRLNLGPCAVREVPQAGPTR